MTAEGRRGVGGYDNLNESNPIELKSGLVIKDLDALASSIIEANYGTHRILSALIRARQKSKKFIDVQPDKLLEGLKELLNSGLH